MTFSPWEGRRWMSPSRTTEPEIHVRVAISAVQRGLACFFWGWRSMASLQFVCKKRGNGAGDGSTGSSRCSRAHVF